jgi:hypothetical protein
MAGLNDLVTNKETTSTTLPSWYSTAQQGLVNQATGVNAPAIGDTAAQSAVSAFGTGSPFSAGQNILQSIGSGAANPWLVSETGQVTPNVNTAMGGLYKSQQDYLNEIMPDIDAGPTAAAISGGGFGSRMNLSGIANARANAASDLFQKQMQSALQNQQTGVSAGVGLGNVGQQLVQGALNTGQFQQNAPYAGATNLAGILGKVQPGQTQEKAVELGGLNQIMGLLAATQGGLGSLTGDYLRDKAGNIVKDANGLPIKTGGIIERIKGLYDQFAGSGSTQPTISGSSWVQEPDSGWFYDMSGETGITMDPSGQYYQNGEIFWSPYWYDSNFYPDEYGSEGE